MAIKMLRSFCVALMVLILLHNPRSLLSCLPPPPRAIFTHSQHPDLPLEGFARGELGVLQPTYARSYLVVAYRYLSGVGLDAAEQKAVLALWPWRQEERDPVQLWLDARSTVPGVSPLPSTDVDRQIAYNEYPNCLADAFQTAARTLKQRIAQFGAESVEVRDWIQAQDQVFANCGGGQSIPAPAPQSAAPLVRADRMYQIAAANFYAGNFIEARKIFTAIAADTSSPWKQIAPYLIARTLIRQAVLGSSDDLNEAVVESLLTSLLAKRNEAVVESLLTSLLAKRQVMLSSTAPNEVDKDPLARAETQLLTVLHDQSLSEYHAAAQQLLNLVRFRLHPAEQLHDLAGYILQKNAGEMLKYSLGDYRALLDKFAGDEEALVDIRSKDEVTDWVLTFQGTGEVPLTHALQKWHETASLPWLVASLAKIDAKHPDASALLEAAQKVALDSPGFPTVAYHSARLLIELRSKDKAREQLDFWLSSKGPVLPPSAHNAFLALRMPLARDLDEFLAYAQRVPAGIFCDEGVSESTSCSEGAFPKGDFPANAAFFDKDATQALNAGMPLSLLTEAAGSQRLSVHPRRELALAAWVRAALLDDVEHGKAIAPIVADLEPTLESGDFDAYLSADTPEARKFAAVFLMLKFPGTRPYVGSGVSRLTPLDEVDNFRENWWCPLVQPLALDVPNFETINAPKESKGAEAAAAVTSFAPAFLDQSQRAAAQKEWQQLSAIGTAPNYLTQQVVDWAKRHPEDPRVPQALHLAVRSTRYGCTDAETSKFSKAAFLLLHKRYPDNPWTKKTPYWY